MRALVLHRHGTPSELALEESWPRPSAGPGEVVIAVAASSLNHHDLFSCRGMPGIKLPLPVIMGCDIAGRIVEVGPSVANWKIGDRVLVYPLHPTKGLMGELLDGGFAEFCAVPADQLVRIPEGVDEIVAAALPTAYGTAHRMLHVNGQIQAGNRVLILGATGGVGNACVLLAKRAGCEVIACTGSDDKLERLRALGADHVINSQTTDFTKWVHATFGKPRRRSDIGGVDVIVNYTGGGTWVPSLKALKAGGKLLTCGATAGFDPVEDLRYVFMHEIRIIGSNAYRPSDLEALLALCASGGFKPHIERVLPLEEAADGMVAMERRETFGKVVIVPRAAAAAAP